jgi:hypothetical protein
MLLIVDFSIDTDIIDVPQFIVDDVESYQTQFLDWLFDKTIDHAYWEYRDGEKYGCNYRSEAFVEWLNAHPLCEMQEKAKVVSSYLQRINF